MSRSHSLVFAACLALGAATLAGGVSLAQGSEASLASAKATVDAAKARGAVGEEATGLLGFVSGGGDAQLSSAVSAINAGRAAAFRNVAARTNVSEAAAGEAAAQQIIGRLPSGAYYKPNGGGWVRK